MSAILRALKKIQTDTAPLSGSHVGPGMSSSARVRESFFIYKGILAAAIILGIALSGAWIIRKTQQSQPEISKPLHEASVIEKSPGPDLAIRETKNRIIDQTQINPVQKEDDPVTKMPPAQFQEQLPKMENQADSPGELEAPPGGHVDVDIIQLPERVVPESIRPPGTESFERMNGSDMDEMDASAGMDLQAISWASDAHKRLAVINGTLCRENESIKGFKIKQINPDDVVVSNGAVTGKLVLKIR